MRVTTSTITIEGYPGVSSGIGLTKLKNLGDITLTGIQAYPIGLDATVTDAGVTNMPSSLQPQQEIPININVTANAAWSGTIGLDFTTDQVKIFFLPNLIECIL
jgi:hypothetical protein